MNALPRSTAILGLSIVYICLTQVRAQAQTPITSIQGAQGGDIVFGSVSGVTTQPAAIAKLLRFVHSDCGEKPQIGRVFSFKGTDSVGVFFTVINHPHGEKHVAGLIIATATGPNQVEAAILSDDASRFGKTVNPMLQQLFSQWNPGGQPAASSSASGGKPASDGGSHPASGHYAPAAKLHTVSTADNAASIGIPDDWHLDPQSGGGALRVRGPQGEMLLVNGHMNAIDLTNPRLPPFMRSQTQSSGTFLYPYRGNLMRDFPNMLQVWRRVSGNPPARVQVDTIKPVDAAPGQECVQTDGYLDSNGNKTHFAAKMCANDSSQNGSYIVWLDLGLLPADLLDQEHQTMAAIYNSVNLNQQVVGQQTQAGLDRIHQIGVQAAADRATRNAGYDAQHAGYWAQQDNNAAQHSAWNAGQDNNARNGQGFSNYMLDQTVVQDNNMYGNGTVGRGTVWNSTADALVKADPNRFQYVDTPNYLKGIDY